MGTKIGVIVMEVINRKSGLLGHLTAHFDRIQIRLLVGEEKRQLFVPVVCCVF